MKCLQCGNRETIDSHVIPKRFYFSGTKVLSAFDGVYPKRLPNGFYDKLLCGVCDGLLGKFDNYGIQLLNYGLLDKETYRSQEGYQFKIIQNYDYFHFTHFILSVLYRSKLSDREFWQNARRSPIGADLVRYFADGGGHLAKYHIFLRYCQDAIAGIQNAIRRNDIPAQFAQIHYKSYLR